MELIRAVLYTADAEVPLRQADENVSKWTRTGHLDKKNQLTGKLLRGSDEWEKFQRRRLVKLDYGGDKASEWWRITRISDSRKASLTLTLRPRYADLQDTIALMEAAGRPMPRVSVTGLTLQNALSRILSLSNAPALYSVGNVDAAFQAEQVYTSAQGISYWALLHRLVDPSKGGVPNARLVFEWTGTGYDIHVSPIATGTEATITYSSLVSGVQGKDLSLSINDEQYFSRIAPVGGGRQASFLLDGAKWVVQTSTLSGSETTVTFAQSPIWEDGVLEGRQALGSSGATYEVLSSTRPNQVTLDGDATAEDYVEFRTASGELLTTLTDDEAESDLGRSVKTKTYSSVTPYENLLHRAGVQANAETLAGWNTSGPASATTVYDPASTQHGQESIRVTADNVGANGYLGGLVTDPLAFDETEMGPYLSCSVRVRVLSGAIGVRLFDDQGNVFPPQQSKIQGTEDTLRGYQLGGWKPDDGSQVKLFVFAREDGTEFDVDGACVTASGGAQPYSELMGAKGLWARAKRKLAVDGGVQPAQIRATTFTTDDLGGSYFFEPGDSVRVVLSEGVRRDPVRTRVQTTTQELSIGKPDPEQEVRIGKRDRTFVDRIVEGEVSADEDDVAPIGGDDGEESSGSEPPQAGFTVNKTGLQVRVSSTAIDPDGDIASVEYTFGDGNSATEATALHTYEQEGPYTITQVVTDSNGLTDSTSVDVTVAPQEESPPTADFTLLIDDANNSVTITIQSTDPDGDLADADIDWGDGSSDTVVNGSAGQQYTHTYSSAGQYTITLTARDQGGRSDTRSRDVDISAPPTGPTADLRVSSESATTEEYTVSLIDESTAGSAPIREWYWDYGAGTSTQQYPTVSLPRGSTEQTYTITLEVTDDNGLTDSATTTFTVPPRDEEGLVPAAG